jgi:hypothetical protein
MTHEDLKKHYEARQEERARKRAHEAQEKKDQQAKIRQSAQGLRNALAARLAFPSTKAGSIVVEKNKIRVTANVGKHSLVCTIELASSGNGPTAQVEDVGQNHQIAGSEGTICNEVEKELRRKIDALTE